MLLDAIELRRVELELSEPVRTWSGLHSARPVLIVRAIGTDCEGYGECAALAEPTYTGEYLDEAERVLAQHLIPRLLARVGTPGGLSGTRTASDFARRKVATEVPHVLPPRTLAPQALCELLGDVKGHYMAKAALEMAVLDADLSRDGISLAAFLGGTASHIRAGATVGIARTAQDLVNQVKRIVDQGYKKVKVKIAPGWDLEPLREIRESFPDLALSADANASYGRADIESLTRLDSLGLVVLEQPFDPDDLVSHAALASKLATPVGLDESICTSYALENAIELNACDAICIKPHRVGGYLEARRIHDICTSAGISIWCGGMFETSFARSAALALAALPGFNMPSDLAASNRYFSTDLAPAHSLEHGMLKVPLAPGVGPRIDERTLRQLTSRSRWFKLDR